MPDSPEQQRAKAFQLFKENQPMLEKSRHIESEIRALLAMSRNLIETYEIYMLPNGEVLSAEHIENCLDESEEGEIENRAECDVSGQWGVNYRNGMPGEIGLHLIVLAKYKHVAVQRALEIQRQLVAENLWPENEEVLHSRNLHENPPSRQVEIIKGPVNV